MKNIKTAIAVILALTLLIIAVPAMAMPGNTTASGNDLSLQKPTGDFGISGTIKDVTNENGQVNIHIIGQPVAGGTLEEIILTISKDTGILDPLTGEKLDADELKAGIQVLCYYGPATTRSIPAIGTADRIEILKDAAYIAGTITERNENDNQLKVLVKTEKDYILYLYITENTMIIDKTGKALKVSDLKEDAKIEAYHSAIMTMSYPGSTEAYKIIVQ